MAGNVPIYVVSIMTGLPADKLFEVPAEICFGPWPSVGVVNFVTVTVTNVFALTPAGSFTVSTKKETNTAVQVGLPDAGAVTTQALVPSKAIPGPVRVMAMPALAPAVIAVAGVKEIVAVVCVALATEASVTDRPYTSPQCVDFARNAMMASTIFSVCIRIVTTR